MKTVKLLCVTLLAGQIVLSSAGASATTVAPEGIAPSLVSEQWLSNKALVQPPIEVPTSDVPEAGSPAPETPPEPPPPSSAEAPPPQSSTPPASETVVEEAPSVDPTPALSAPQAFAAPQLGKVTGNWGTAPFEFDTATGVLTVQGGEISPTTPAGVTRTAIKEIVFGSGVSFPANSTALFGGTGAATTAMNQLTTITGLENVDTSNVTTMQAMFRYCTSLESLNLSNFNTSHVTNFQEMFASCTGLTTVDVSSFDTSQATTFMWMFGNSGFTALDLHNFNTSRVTNISNMFSGCSALTTLDLSSFNTRAITTAANKATVFANCTSLNSLSLGADTIISGTSLPSISTTSGEYTGAWNNYSKTNGWYSNSTTFMSGYNGTSPGTYVWEKVNTQQLWGTAPISFDAATGVLTVQAGQLDQFGPTGGIARASIKEIIFEDGVTFPDDATNLFGGSAVGSAMSQLATITGLEKVDTSNVTNMTNMFAFCTMLNSMDLSAFNTSHVTTMSGMFRNMNTITSLNLSSFDTSQVTDMSNMFFGNQSMTSADTHSFNTAQVTTMATMFSGCGSLNNLNMNSFTITPTTTITNMLASTVKLTNITLGASVQTLGGVGLPAISAEKMWATGMNTDTPNTYGTSALLMSNYDGSHPGEYKVMGAWGNAPTEWDPTTGTLTVYAGTLAYDNTPGGIAKSIIQKIDFVAPIIFPADSHELFGGATTQLIAGVTPKMTSLTEITGMDKVDTSQVTNMSRMFASLYKLKSLDLSSFDTSNVTSMYMLFASSPLLTRVDMSNFDMGKVTDKTNMFGKDLSSNTDGGARPQPPIEELVLGPKTQINGTGLHAIAATLSWGTMLDTGGPFLYGTSADFMTNYDGSHPGVYSAREYGLWGTSPTEWDATTGTLTVYAGTLAYDNTPGGIDKSIIQKIDFVAPIIFPADSHELFGGATTQLIAGVTPKMTSLTEITGMDKVDTSQVTNMSRMFASLYKLKSLDLSSFDTSNVTSMYMLFASSPLLTRVDMSNFDMGKVTDKTNMFGKDLSSNTDGGARPQPPIEELVLGPKTRINGTGLHAISVTNRYTGKWERSAPINPYVSYASSAAFMSGYDGTSPGTYVWQENITETINVQDIVLFVGDTWDPQENFLSATNRAGDAVSWGDPLLSFEEDQNNPVDTGVIGTYNVLYRNDRVSKAAKVRVVASLAAINVHDSTIFVGDTQWTAEDNFDSALDKFGMPAPYSAVTVDDSQKDVSVPGSFTVTYSINGVSATATITVVNRDPGIYVHDSTLYAGDPWTAADNFDAAIDENGNALTLDQLTVTGAPNMTQAGTYEIVYSYGTLSSTATVTVIDTAGQSKWIDVTIPTQIVYASTSSSNHQDIASTGDNTFTNNSKYPLSISYARLTESDGFTTYTPELVDKMTLHTDEGDKDIISGGALVTPASSLLFRLGTNPANPGNLDNTSWDYTKKLTLSGLTDTTQDLSSQTIVRSQLHLTLEALDADGNTVN